MSMKHRYAFSIIISLLSMYNLVLVLISYKHLVKSESTAGIHILIEGDAIT